MDLLGHEAGVLAQTVARSFDLDYDGMAQQAVEQCCGEDRIAEHPAPFGKAAVRSQDHRALLVTGIHELEEQIAAAGHDRQVADLVHDEERGAAEIPDAVAQGAVALGLGQRGDESARVVKATLRPALTASTANAVARWLSPVPGGPTRWMTSARSVSFQLGLEPIPVEFRGGCPILLA